MEPHEAGARQTSVLEFRINNKKIKIKIMRWSAKHTIDYMNEREREREREREI